ncbi:hypothetical protein CXF97_09660 [Pseudomonas sp. Choline-02u-1]|nr:hypothetical protein CXF97_09660 [Pseudomonas sp. Choline-02u-1]
MPAQGLARPAWVTMSVDAVGRDCWRHAIPLWERACSRKRQVRQSRPSMYRRLREQAHSHLGLRRFQERINAVDSWPGSARRSREWHCCGRPDSGGC